MSLHLRLSWKPALISSCSTVPLVCGTFNLLNKYTNKDIDAVIQEQRGIRFLQPLDKLLEVLPHHQALVLRSRAGDAGAVGELAAKKEQVDRAFAALEAVTAELGSALQYSAKDLAQQKKRVPNSPL